MEQTTKTNEVDFVVFKLKTMKILKVLSISLCLLVIPKVYGQTSSATKPTETPAKTIVIKHPSATNTVAFFAGSKTFMFEVYKPGDVAKILSALKKDSNVESCVEGIVTGDYHQLNLTIKTAKDKKWFTDLFKKAGLNTIKINNNPIVEVEKM